MVSLLIALVAGGIVGVFWKSVSATRRYTYVGFFAALTLLSTYLTLSFNTSSSLIATVFGNWKVPYGIALVGDPFSFLLVTLTLLVTVSATLYHAFTETDETEKPYALPLLSFLSLGICLSFLTNDLFNLFVAFEIMLISSYGLLFQQEKTSLNSIFLYIKINVIGGLFFLASTGIFYAMTGTLSLAQAGEVITMAADMKFLMLAAILIFVFALKGGLFPLYYWLPGTYPVLPIPILVVFGSMLTKVGIYAIVRVSTLVFPLFVEQIGTLLWWIAIPTMIVGVISAVSRTRLMEVLSLHIISQIGFMCAAISYFSLLSLKATVFYMVHHILVTASLFLVAGIAIRYAKTDILKDMGGLWRKEPLLSFLFGVQALSLAGLPPFSGFWGKLMIFKVSINLQDWFMVGCLVVSGMLTILSMIKVLYYVFWSDPNDDSVLVTPPNVAPLKYTTLALVCVSLWIGLFPAPLLELSEKASQFLMEPRYYSDTILNSGGDKP
jgi:multicomponent Na+:H+ antiporter subunit D